MDRSTDRPCSPECAPVRALAGEPGRAARAGHAPCAAAVRVRTWAFAAGLSLSACVDEGPGASAAAAANGWLEAALTTDGDPSATAQPPTLAPLHRRGAALGWSAPTATCAHVLAVDQRFDWPPLNEADGSAVVTLTSDAASTTPLAPEALRPGLIHYRGPKIARRGQRRRVTFAASLPGPTSPVSACYPRSWDPVEDVFALAYPQLPARTVAVGETWDGARVGGRCNRSACIDEQTLAGGRDVAQPVCMTAPWRETLRGLVQLGDEPFAVIESEWDDTHGERGIRTTRKALVSVRHGRPAWVEVLVDHRYAVPTKRDPTDPDPQGGGMVLRPVQRTWRAVAVDACPGSLRAAGFAGPPRWAALADEGARIVEELAEAPLVEPTPRPEPQLRLPSDVEAAAEAARAAGAGMPPVDTAPADAAGSDDAPAVGEPVFTPLPPASPSPSPAPVQLPAAPPP